MQFVRSACLCYIHTMNTRATTKKDLGRIAIALNENISEEEMDGLLTERHEEVAVLLEEARVAIAHGEVAPLEPLHTFLCRARERLKASR
jgi:hypothetical protein